MADRIVVMQHGRVRRVFERGVGTPETVVAAASGIDLEQEQEKAA
jgi:rhamnose transport system ATP-binding protein